MCRFSDRVTEAIFLGRCPKGFLGPLGRVLGTGPDLWMNLQSRYEIETARAALGEALDGVKPIAARHQA